MPLHITVTMEESIQKFLATPDARGQDIHSHLSEVFSHILKDSPNELYSEFESVSAFVKKNNFVYRQPQSDSQVNSLPKRTTPLTPWINSSLNLLEKHRERGSAGVWVEKQPPQLGVLPNLLADCELLKWAGVSFGEEETYRLSASLKKLMHNSGARGLRLWGKVFGTTLDYYIAEGAVQSTGKEDIERPKDFESRGTGLNEFTYWATNQLFSEWVELPDVSPQQLQTARQVKKYFTGDLNAEVRTYPSFPGKERHLLRAQIARISSATILIPKGLMKVNEEDPSLVELEEEPAVLNYEEAASEESWVHAHAHILRAGRVAHIEPEVPDNEEIDLEELKNKLIEEDPPVDRLRGLAEDESWTEEERPWVFSLPGDGQVYALKPPGEGNTCYAVNVIRNRRWPGALTVFRMGHWTNLYLGYGLKSTDQVLRPVAPPDVLDDPEDPMEQPEPTPLEAPVEPGEESSDGEKDPEEDEG